MGAFAAGSASDIREYLADLLDRAVFPAQFWSWFVRAQPRIERHGTNDEFELATLVENRFAEYTGGDAPAEQLLQALAADLNRDVAPVAGDNQKAAVG